MKSHDAQTLSTYEGFINHQCYVLASLNLLLRAFYVLRVFVIHKLMLQEFHIEILIRLDMPEKFDGFVHSDWLKKYKKFAQHDPNDDLCIF